MLGNTYVMWTENNGFWKQIVSQCLQLIMNHSPSVSVVMTCKVADIFKEGIFRLMVFKYSANIEKQCSFGFVIKSKSFTCF